ncbi:histidine kinase [Micromonospora sp. NPDC023737]|uniref:sensor histidine kinase n=1 Tax=unclassified Micromonospora TaxID=2617518 RepID=UPI0033F3D117
MTVIRRVIRRPLRSVAFDVFVVGLVLFFGLVAVASQPGWKASLVGVGMAVPLLFRRAFPVTVAGVVGALGLVQLIGEWGPLPYDIAVLVALYSVVKYADRLRDGVLAGIGALAGAVPAALQVENGGRWWGSAIVLGLITGAIWLVGLNVRTRRLYVLSLEERAATLEREREAEARAAVAGERTRIAQELHDVVAHGMAVMIVQADGARFMIDRDPEAARQAVKVVADTGRQALEEMRRLVGVLREPSAPEATIRPEPDDAPVGGDPERRRLVLAELPALLDRFRGAGLRVRQTVTGEPATLPPGLELTVYRVAQEALTNALKHAGVGAEVELTLEYGPDDVFVRVVDDGQGRPAVNPTPSGGHGLIGMRERVGVYDGSLAAGARPAGGWQLEVRLPLPSRAGTTEVIAA